MRRIFQKELDMILHWNLTLVGGFLGTYAILLHAGNFGSCTDRKCHGDGGGTYRKKICRSGDTIFSISYFWKCDRDFLSVDEFYETGYAKAGALGRRSGTHRNSDDAGGDVCGCEPLPDIFLFGISVGQLFRRIGV